MPANPDFKDLFSIFNEEGVEYQIGVEPNRIDILMGVSGVDFESAWAERVESTYGGVSIHIMGKNSLIKTKKASGRPQDLLDLEKLQ